MQVGESEEKGDRVSPGFSDQFHHYLAPSADQTFAAITEGLVVLDTNVLLDAYRFTPPARVELFEALTKVGDRLFCPHQVALEFHKNRYSVISNCEADYKKAIEAIGDLRKAFEEGTKRQLAEFANRVSLPKENATGIEDAISDALDSASATLTQLWKQHDVPNSPTSSDPILERLQRLYEGKVGSPFTPAEEAEALREAQSRIESKTPPGYKDSGKPDPHGDYFVWRQALNEARKRAKPLLFVTRDVKEDWYWRPAGKQVGPDPWLARECMEYAGVPLSMMTVATFLHHAREKLSASVSESTLAQADQVARSDTSEEMRPVRTLTAERMRDLIEDTKLARDTLQAHIRTAEASLAEAEYLMNASDGEIVGERFTARLRRLHTYLAEARAELAFIERLLKKLTAKGSPKPGQRVPVSQRELTQLVWLIDAIRDGVRFQGLSLADDTDEG